MRKPVIAFSAIFFTVIFLLSCKTAYQPQSVNYTDYHLDQHYKKDSNIIAILKPYTDSVNNKMNEVVAVSSMTLERKQPEGTLGNFMVDAMLIMAKEKYNIPVDAAFFNDGGIRLPSIAAGNITRGKIYELSPFDNIIVLQKLSGKVLLQFLDHISGMEGWPCAGIAWQIKNNKAINVSVNGMPINESGVYTIANIDYVANGGNDCNMLRPIHQENNGYLFREALFDYLKRLTAAGKTVSAKIENRVTNAN